MTNIKILKKPIANNITETIGNTPLIRLNNINKDAQAEILVKNETFNPVGSIKDRVAVSLIDEAEKSGKLNKDTTIIEPTSGNMGIALGFVTAARGYNLIITMPESMSKERQKLIKIFGAKIILTPAADGMSGAVKEAEKIQKETPNSIILGQFENEANPLIHEKTTAKEILTDTDNNIDILVAGVGTGGTITGISQKIKKTIPDLISVAVEPETSPMLSKGQAGAHRIQGIGAGFIPDVVNKDIIDQVITVSDEDARNTMLKLAKEEGIFTGISSGAAVYASLQLAKLPENKDKRIVAILPDTGERYLSVEWLFNNL
ncbi:MAG: cysteine synthase A [Methanobacteriaceae archaeon]|nr:cysteine synthase A [Methanobacteriaceae archaeon]